MTTTPWGEASELRERMLVSSPRPSPEEAARNQRERLFGAIVALCEERGYEATTVGDLVGLSGVSRRDFYRHFASKQACFEAALETILTGVGGSWRRAMTAKAGRCGSWSSG
jgi:AcrR family transcriptional regulator